MPTPKSAIEIWTETQAGSQSDLSAVSAAITVLSRLDESQLKELASSGLLAMNSEFVTDLAAEVPDTERWDDIQEAPTRALTAHEYEAFLRGDGSSAVTQSTSAEQLLARIRAALSEHYSTLAPVLENLLETEQRAWSR